MAKATKFEGLEVWKKSRILVKTVFLFSKSIKDRNFTDQIERAALSVMNNIAEGHESGSRKAFARYLKIAKGSCGEVRSLFYAGYNLKYITFGKHREGLALAEELSRMLAGFISSVSKGS